MLIRDRAEFDSKPRPLCYPPDTPVLEAVKVMSERNYGSVVVTNPDETIAGIVTERDLMRRVLAKELDPKTATLKDIMTTEVRSAKETDRMIDWLQQMSNERFRHLPIVDENGKVTKMMSQGDFVAYTWPELLGRLTETAKAALAPKYQILLIVGAILIYTLIMPFIFGAAD